MLEPDTFELFFSLLTLLAIAGTVTLWVARLMARSGNPSAQHLVAGVAHVRTPLAAAVAVTAMLGSLYFSEVANYVPCNLCWYQRIAMYSSAIILVVAAIRRDDVRWYAGSLAAIGAVISSYHILIERFPSLESGVCSVAVPCNLIWFERFGFITLAVMALVGFLTIITLVSLPTLPQESHDGNVDTQ
jgi:disulfide bond formation protein DsbB